MNPKAESAPLIYQKMSKIMSEIKPVAKERQNLSQNYKFRGIDDFYQAVQGPMARNGVISIPDVLEDRTEDRRSKSGAELIYRVLKVKYTFSAEDGSSVSATVIGEGMDSGDKASNKAMAAAHKYALLQVFCIPTDDEKDSEYDQHETTGRQEKVHVHAKIEPAVASPKPTPTIQKPAPPPKQPSPPDAIYRAKANSADDKALCEYLEKNHKELNVMDWDLIADKLSGKSKREIEQVIKDYKAQKPQIYNGGNHGESLPIKPSASYTSAGTTTK